MSYDVALCVTNGITDAEIWSANYTSNCSPMWRQAGLDLRLLHRERAAEAGKIVHQAIRNMRADPAAYKALEPSNGWGDYGGALTFLIDIREACRRLPDLTVVVWS